MSTVIGKKASLPEILELNDVSERDQAVLWLEEAIELKTTIGKEPEKGKEGTGTGLLGKLAELKDRLFTFAGENGLEGIRHNKLVFSLQLVQGRETVDLDAVVNYLLEHGVEAKLVGEAIAQAKKRGENYWKKDLAILK